MDKKLKILLIRTDKIGDVILTTPAVAAIREKYPQAEISFLAGAYARSMLENNGGLDEVITEKGFFETLREIRSRNFDIAVIFFVNREVSLLAFLAGIPVRIGPASKIWSLFLNRRVYQHRSQIKKHEADYNLELTRALGADAQPREPVLNLTSGEKSEGWELLSRVGLSKEDFIVALHPGSGGSALNWPKEHFAALADRLLKEFPVKVLLTGSPAEAPLLEEIASLMTAKPVILREAMTLRHFAGLISLCKLFVTNSTGPLHIAAALHVPTVSFFPPIKPCSPVRWGPYGKGVNKVLVPPGPDCPRCVQEKCSRYRCMHTITVDSAFKEAAEILNSVYFSTGSCRTGT